MMDIIYKKSMIPPKGSLIAKGVKTWTMPGNEQERLKCSNLAYIITRYLRLSDDPQKNAQSLAQKVTDLTNQIKNAYPHYEISANNRETELNLSLSQKGTFAHEKASFSIIPGLGSTKTCFLNMDIKGSIEASGRILTPAARKVVSEIMEIQKVYQKHFSVNQQKKAKIDL